MGALKRDQTFSSLLRQTNSNENWKRKVCPTPQDSSFCFTNAFLNGINSRTTMQYIKVFNSIFRNFSVFYFHWFVVRRRNFDFGWCTDRTFTDIRNFWQQALLSHVRVLFTRHFYSLLRRLSTEHRAGLSQRQNWMKIHEILKKPRWTSWCFRITTFSVLLHKNMYTTFVYTFELRVDGKKAQ